MSEPTQDAKPSSEEDSMNAEEEAIRLGVADVTLAWATIENCMVLILREIIKDSQGAISSAIYFTPSSIEIRIKIIHNSFRQLFRFNPVFRSHLLGKWTTVINKLGRLRKTRNKVAHGEIVGFAFVDGRKSFVRLTSPVFKIADDDTEEHQKPGLGSSELRTSSAAVMAAARDLAKFIEYIKLVHADDLPTLLQILGEAKDETPSPPLPDNQTPPEPGPPPPPFEE